MQFTDDLANTGTILPQYRPIFQNIKKNSLVDIPGDDSLDIPDLTVLNQTGKFDVILSHFKFLGVPLE